MDVADSLLDLAERSPTKIAVTCVPEIGMSNGLEAARPVEPRSRFVSDGFVLDETVFAR